MVGDGFGARIPVGLLGGRIDGVVNCNGRMEAAALGEVVDQGGDQPDRGKDLAGNKADEVKSPILLEVKVDLFAVGLDQLPEGVTSPSSVFSP